MNIKIKEKRGITLISLVVTIILLLILAGISIAMLTGENGIFKTAQKAKLESQKGTYREIIELAKNENEITTDRERTKNEKLDGISEILNKDKNLGQGTGTQINKEYQDKENPRLVVKTKEGWVYIVTVDGIKELGKVDGDIPLDVDIKNGDIKYIYEPNYWTNSDVEVSLSIAKEEYKEFKIQYSYDLKTWKDYTEKIVVENNKAIYSRITTGTSVSESYATGNVINIDKKEAEISTAMNSSNVTTKGFTVNVGVKDENSGLGKIVWYYKKSDATSYTSEEVIYKELHSIQSGETTAVTKSKTYDNLTSGTYNVYAEIYDVAGNITRANSSDKPLEITLGKVTGLTTANTTFTANPTEWTNGKVTMTASTNVSGYTIQTSKDAQTWSNTASQEFTENGKIYARLWDGTNAGGYSTGNVTNIDTLSPKDFNITTTSSTGTITVTANTTDADATSTSGSSGIAGYRFKLNNGNWTNYQTSGTYSFSNLIGSVSGEKYNIYVETKDNSGNVTSSTKEVYTTKDNDYYVDKANTLIGEVDYNYSVNRKYYKTNDKPAIVVWSTMDNLGEYDYFGPILVSTNPDAVKYYTSEHPESFPYGSSFEYNGVTFYVSGHDYFFETDRSVYKTDYLSIGNTLEMHQWPDIGKELATRYFTGSTDKNYTVYYNANGGTGIPNMQTKRKDSALTLSTTVPTRNGYHFLGWSTNKTSSTAEYMAGGTYNLNKSEILYAVWQKHNNENDIKGTCSICGGGDKLIGTEQLNEQWNFTAKHMYSTKCNKNVITTDANKNGSIHMSVSWVANWNGSTGDYSQGGNVGMLISKNKIDLTNVDKIIMNCTIGDNHPSGINYTTLGISSSNSSSSSSDYDAFNKSVTVSQNGSSPLTLSDKKLILDVSNISGEYYVKVTTKHDLKVNLAYTADTYIYSMFLVYK